MKKKKLTVREAWKALSKLNGKNFLCNELYWMSERGEISSATRAHMEAQIEQVRRGLHRRDPGSSYHALWPEPHPERARFCRLAARGHAKDYVYPEALLWSNR